MSILAGLLIAEWSILIGWWLGAWIDGVRDRRMMRRLNAQPWWPPIGTRMPTTADLKETLVIDEVTEGQARSEPTGTIIFSPPATYYVVNAGVAYRVG